MPALSRKLGKKAVASKSGNRADPATTGKLRGQVRQSGILEALIEHAEGKREMTSSQVTAGLNLLKKVLPDLASVQMGGETTHTVVHRIERRIVNAQAGEKAKGPPQDDPQAGIAKTRD